MPVYYRGPDALITHEVLSVRVPRRQTFRIADLEGAYIVQPSRRSTVVVSAHTAGGAIAVAVAGWPLLQSPLACLLVVLAVALPAAVAVYSGRRHDRTQELWATVGQHDVLLYASSDPTRFGQVARALARALADYQEKRNFLARLVP